MAPAPTIRIVATAVSIAWIAVLYLAGVHIQQGARQILAYVPSAIVLLATMFDKWAWRWPVVHKLVARPRIDGLWRATLTPSAESLIPEGGNRGPVEAYLVLEQSFWSVSVTLYTAESASHSVAATFRRRSDSKQFVLSYVYENQPRQTHLSRSPHHVGGSELDIGSPFPTSISGRYFTDRYTAGDMELSLVSRDTNVANFTEAQARAKQA